MDFSYSEEQREMKTLADRILGDHATPERLKQIESGEERFDPELWAALAQAGLLGADISDAHGGSGLGFETLCLLAEAVGQTAAPAPVVPVLVSAASSLQKFAAEEIRERYLPDVANGSALLSAALIEPGNEDPARPGTRAESSGGEWRLSGTKQCVPFAQRASAVLLTAAVGSDTGNGPAVFLVEPTVEGVSCTPQQVTSGENQYVLELGNAPATLVAEGETAAAMIRWMCEATAAALSTMAVGLCDTMMRMTASYTSERHQFGVPVATFQAVRHQQADSFIDIECLRLVSQQAISLLDRGADATEAVRVAQIWTGDTCHRVSQNSQQCHGGIGVDRDYPLFRYCLWARQVELACGSSAAQLAELGAGIARRAAG